MNFDHDQKMYAKGYRYCCEPTKKEFEPLYVKSLSLIGPLYREYPDTLFDVRQVVSDVKIKDLLELWKSNQKKTIEILAEEHPAVVAMLIAQGVADGEIKKGDLNSIANLLIDKRIKLAQS